MIKCETCDNEVSLGGGRVTVKLTKESWHLCINCFERFNKLELARNNKLLIEKIVSQQLIEVPKLIIPPKQQIPFYKRRGS